MGKISNAWKFTAQRKQVKIKMGTTQVKGQRLNFICDNGVEFDTPYADKLFKAFRRFFSMSGFEAPGLA